MSQAEKISKVPLRVIALGTDQGLPERYLSTKEGFELMKFSTVQPCDFIEAYANGNLPIFKKIAATGTKEDYRVAESVKLPAGAKSVLIFGWITQDAMRYLAIADDILEAKSDNWLMVNTSDTEISFQIGWEEEPFRLKPSSIEKCKLTAEAGKGAAVKGRAILKGKVKTFYSTYWPIREGERSIVIFIKKNNRIVVKKIGDLLLRE